MKQVSLRERYFQHLRTQEEVSHPFLNVKFEELSHSDQKKNVTCKICQATFPASMFITKFTSTFLCGVCQLKSLDPFHMAVGTLLPAVYIRPCKKSKNEQPLVYEYQENFFFNLS